MTVSHILQAKGRDVITAAPTAKVSDVARILSERRIGAVVITGAGGRIEGIVSERDVVRHIGKDGASALDLPVSAIMTRAVRTAREADTEAELMSLMTAHRIRHLPVTHEGKLSGMISIGDVVKHRIEAIEREAEEMKAYIATAG
ncbi:CBS domain-containing protein [Aestuariivirga sp.]|uniref:CBS domain-containing protein n=1 Tax=Aestuariivirga sp. TaxID=2650926 RepID=UPI0039E69665